MQIFQKPSQLPIQIRTGYPYSFCLTPARRQLFRTGAGPDVEVTDASGSLVLARFTGAEMYLFACNAKFKRAPDGSAYYVVRFA